MSVAISIEKMCIRDSYIILILRPVQLYARAPILLQA